MVDYFDLHCDTPYECYNKNIAFDNVSLAVNGKNNNLFGIHKQCFAVWIRDDADRPFELYKSILNNFKSKFALSDSSIFPIYTVEGGAVIQDDVERLFELKNDGIKMLGLTWNGKNSIASGVYEEGSLTDFGKNTIRRMNELSIICDLAHLNNESFFAALEEAERAVVSHTCCDKVFAHPRNLSDDAIRAVCQRNGLIGICLYPIFLGGNDPYEDFYRHVFHMLDLGYEKNICIGSDFDGAEMHGTLSGINDIKKLFGYIVDRGVPYSIAENVFFKNANNFFSNL